jgi:DNA-binding transcriptional MocR family regulator
MAFGCYNKFLTVLNDEEKEIRMEFDHLLADRTRFMDVNAIREILKVVSQPAMVSLAGGIPAPASFPLEIIHELTSIVINKYFPDNFNWSRPEGGMFIWAEGPEGSDMEALNWKAVAEKVAYVTGRYFYTGRDEGRGTMRLNFTMADEETLDLAVSTLAKVIEKELNRGQSL